jgi:hypothetical protein
MRAPVHIVHIELVRIRSHVASLQTIVLETLITSVACPDKNEDNAEHKKYVRQIGLFKR